MSVLEAADDAVRCLRKRQAEVNTQLDQLALIAAEIDGMTDVLELQEEAAFLSRNAPNPSTGSGSARRLAPRRT